MVIEILISVTILFVGIAALVVIHSDLAQRNSNGISEISKEDWKELSCFDYKAEGRSPVDCVVCLENFKVGDKCRLLPNCRHNLYAQRVDSWLLKTPICPVCRTRVGPPKIRVILKIGYLDMSELIQHRANCKSLKSAWKFGAFRYLHFL